MVEMMVEMMGLNRLIQGFSDNLHILILFTSNTNTLLISIQNIQMKIVDISNKYNHYLLMLQAIPIRQLLLIYLSSLKGCVYILFHSSMSCLMLSLLITLSVSKSLKLSTLEKVAAQYMVTPKKTYKIIELEQLLEKVRLVAVRNIHAPIIVAVYWITFSINLIFEHIYYSWNTVIVYVSRYSFVQKKSKPKKWINGHDTEYIRTTDNIMNTIE